MLQTVWRQENKRAVGASWKAACDCVECALHNAGDSVHIRAIELWCTYYTNSHQANHLEPSWASDPYPIHTLQFAKRCHLGKQWPWCWVDIWMVYFCSFGPRPVTELKWLVYVGCILLCLNLGPFSWLADHSKTSKPKTNMGYLHSSGPLASIAFSWA